MSIEASKQGLNGQGHHTTAKGNATSVHEQGNSNALFDPSTTSYRSNPENNGDEPKVRSEEVTEGHEERSPLTTVVSRSKDLLDTVECDASRHLFPSYPAMGEVLTSHHLQSFSKTLPNNGKTFQDYYFASYEHTDNWELDQFCPSYIEYSGFTGKPSFEHYGKTSLNGIYMGMPGMGNAKASCGQVTHRISCKSCDEEPTFVTHHCDRITCPTCAPKVRARQSKEIEERLLDIWEQYRKLGLVKGNPQRYLKHITLSPPQDKFASPQDFLIDKASQHTIYGGKVDYDRIENNASQSAAFRNQDNLTRKAKTILNDAVDREISPVSGGVLLFHGFRKNHTDGSSCEDDNCHQEHIWEWSPHFHYIGFGWFEGGDKVFEKTGWILKNIPNKGKRSASHTVSYILSHVTVIGHTYVDELPKKDILDYGQLEKEPIELKRKERSRHTYRWIMDFSNYAVALDYKTEIEEPDICKSCGHQRYITPVHDLGDDEFLEYGDEELHYLKTTARTYRIRLDHLHRRFNHVLPINAQNKTT